MKECNIVDPYIQPFSQDYGLASHATHVVCVNFIRNRTYNFFTASLFTLRGFAKKCWEEIAEKICFFFQISFWCLTWDMNQGFTFNKLTHYLLDYGDCREKIKTLQLSGLTYFWPKCLENYIQIKVHNANYIKCAPFFFEITN